MSSLLPPKFWISLGCHGFGRRWVLSCPLAFNTQKLITKQPDDDFIIIKKVISKGLREEIFDRSHELCERNWSLTMQRRVRNLTAFIFIICDEIWFTSLLSLILLSSTFLSSVLIICFPFFNTLSISCLPLSLFSSFISPAVSARVKRVSFWRIRGYVYIGNRIFCFS